MLSRFKACRDLCTSQAQRRPLAAPRAAETTAQDVMDTPQASPAGLVPCGFYPLQSPMIFIISLEGILYKCTLWRTKSHSPHPVFGNAKIWNVTRLPQTTEYSIYTSLMKLGELPQRVRQGELFRSSRHRGFLRAGGREGERSGQLPTSLLNSSNTPATPISGISYIKTFRERKI